MNQFDPTREASSNSQARWASWLRSPEGRAQRQNAAWILLQRDIALRRRKAMRRSEAWEVLGLIALVVAAAIVVVLAMAW